MRKLTCILLTLIMVIGTAAFSFADVSEPVTEEVKAAQLEQQSKEALEYIQTHLDEIDAQILCLCRRFTPPVFYNFTYYRQS